MDSLLIIEDDQSTCARLVNVFKRKGFRVRSAETLKKAYSLFEEERPNCILMDLHFPEGNSLESFYTSMLALQEKNDEAPCPIVILTASDAEEDLRELLACGIYTVHSKHDPMDMVEDSIRKEIIIQKRATLRLIKGARAG